MSPIIFFLIVFWVIVPRLREQEKTRTATDAARRDAARRAGQQLRQDPPPARSARQDAQSDAPQYSYPTAAQRNAAAQTPPIQEARYRPIPPRRAEKKPQAAPDKKKFQSFFTALGGVLGTIGAGACGAMAITALAEFLNSLFHGYFFPDEIAAPLILALLAVACGLGARRCFISRQQAKRYELYKTIIGTQRTCPVADIARASGRKPKKVLRDLQEMVRAGLFPLGFVDEETACFYANNDAWRAANPERARAQDEALGAPGAGARQAAPAPEPEDEDAPGDSLSEDDLRALHREIARVENPDIREKAARLAHHAEDIFAWVKLHPECADDVRRFCSYYLPTAAKLLATYNEIAPHAGESSVAASVETEVSKVLDTMNTAYRELMDHLLQNTAVDMQAEISALETVLAQEGLTQDGLKL